MPKQFTYETIRAHVIPTAETWVGYKLSGMENVLPCVDDLYAFIQKADAECAAAEDNGEFSAEGIARRRATIGERALVELRKLHSFQKADKTCGDCIAHIDKNMTGPAKLADSAIAAEIRNFIRSQPSASRYIMTNTGNVELMAAVLNAPPFLTGLSDDEYQHVRNEVRAKMHPELATAQARFTTVRKQLAEGVAAAERLISKRTGMRMDPDGVVRKVTAPLPIEGMRPAQAA